MTNRLVFISGFIGALAVIAVGAYFVLFAPADYQGTKTEFRVLPGQSVVQIIDNLKAEGFLRSSWGGRIVLSTSGTIQAGTYQLSQRMNAWQVASVFAKSKPDKGGVTIPEGYTIQQIAERLEDRGIITAGEFTSVATNSPGKGSRPDGSLEGYLFPDTYNFYTGLSAEQIVKLMTDNFDKRIAGLQSQIDEQREFNLHQLITLASLVEEEARTETDRKLIAGVLMNRMRSGMRLDVDATVRYITNNWTKPITKADLEIDSPYNTRKHAGLPPGPICNPGLAAIKAVLSPTDSDYLYYLTDGKGATHYAKTLAEHNTNKAKYL